MSTRETFLPLCKPPNPLLREGARGPARRLLSPRAMISTVGGLPPSPPRQSAPVQPAPLPLSPQDPQPVSGQPAPAAPR